MTPQAPTTTLRKLTLQDHARWQTLWDAYTRFYEREPDPATTAQGTEHIVGIAHDLPHENTSQLTPVSYLQDLYADPAARASGVGKQIIDWLITECKAQNWSALYWNTRETNYRARALYDKYTPQSGFLVYRIKGLNKE
jgi:GNAT superfamily N-acetyltransferase